MKDYIFILDNQIEAEEIIIEASGMMDAFMKAKELQRKRKIDKKSNVNLLFKGISY
ncbi:MULTISPECIES: hypothetical protein [Bacillaceae]|uniref:Competence protein ComGF n=1 Tax=Peribacillus huizhouensis TaxID=1501239 RepID=A0ABR6CR03_9BACI|nr:MULTISPECIES: hypothetical protein [Bacillaceae]MBA9027341.1 competence protein ComGF [Peribacillus huizhouensis]